MGIFPPSPAKSPPVFIGGGLGKIYGLEVAVSGAQQVTETLCWSHS